jgi:protein-S-isoprenylcysteine O-methyltransferase Ste14
MNRLWIALRSAIYATLFLAAWAWVAFRCRGLDAYLPLRLPAGGAIPGRMLFLAGAALALATVIFFIVEGGGTPAPFDPPKKFVPRGPYRWVRNPMYVGGVAMLLGLGLRLASVAMVLFALVALLLIHAFVVGVEEPGLRRRFGKEYEDYCRAVPRWLPRLTRRAPSGGF